MVELQCVSKSLSGLSICRARLLPAKLTSARRSDLRPIAAFLDRKSMITHIVASNLTPSKFKEFAVYKVAKPEWLVDSLAEGRLLNWQRYSLHAVGAAGSSAQADKAPMAVAQPSLFGMGLKRPDVPETPARAAKTVTFAPSTTEGQMTTDSAVANQPDERVRQQTAADFYGVGPPTSKPTTPGKQVQQPATSEPGSGAAQAWCSEYLPTHQVDRSALMNDRQWMLENTSLGGAAYVKSYFLKSRLHYLSTWKEELKALVAELQPAASIPKNRKLEGTPKDNRTILHADFDAFFVSAGLTTRPDLRGKAVAVCHGSAKDAAGSTSEIASCSYEARAFGIKSGMSLGKARELCPEIQTIPFEFDKYKQISHKFYAILQKYSETLQAVSIDEALIEVVLPTATALLDPALELAEKIRTEVREATGCEVSVGIGHNILLAKLANRKAKPAGAFHLVPSEVDAFLAPLEVRDLPGIGWSTEQKLARQGVNTVGDLRKLTRSQMMRFLGEQNGRKFGSYSRGIDPTELAVGKVRQSVSAEVNYGIRFTMDKEPVQAFMAGLSEEVATRLRAQGLKAKSITLKIKSRHPDSAVDTPKFLGHGVAIDTSDTTKLHAATDQSSVIEEAVMKMLTKMNFAPPELRGIGIQLQKFEKDGRPVDTAGLERGQGRLSFGPKAVMTDKRPPPAETSPDVSETESDAQQGKQGDGQSSKTTTRTVTPPLEPLPAPLQPRSPTKPPPRPPKRDLDVLVLDDSDSEGVDDPESPIPGPVAEAALPPAPLQPLPPAPRPMVGIRKAAQPAAPIIPRMFTKAIRKRVPLSPSQISDADLKHYGVGIDYFRGVGREEQEAILAAAQAGKGPPPKRTKSMSAPLSPTKNRAGPTDGRLQLGGVTKPGVAGGRQKSKTPVPVMARIGPIPVITLPEPTPPTSPTTITDEQLKKYGIADAEMFRALPRSLQLEELERRKKFQVKADKRSRAVAAVVPVLEFPIRDTPKFQKAAVATDAVRGLLAGWFDASVRSAPPAKDLDYLGRYCEKLAVKGGDLSKVVDVLGYWRMLMEDSWGTEVEIGRGVKGGTVAREWWKGYGGVRERVGEFVKRERGKVLKGL